MHEYWLVCETHGLFRFNRAPCTNRICPLYALSYRCPPQWWRCTVALRAAVRHIDLFLAPSRFVECKHRELGLDLPMAYLPNFVPAPVDPAEKVATIAASFFLFVGCLKHLKGLHTLIPVFRCYLRARLVVAGSGSREVELRGMAAHCRNIQFLGHLKGGYLADVLRQATALIFPSLSFESAPLVVLEAFSYGTPALVRHIGSMPEVIQQSSGGFTYQTDEELMRAMDLLLDSASLRAELGRRARAAWESTWSPEAHVERYFELIHQRLDRGQGRE